MEYFLIFLAFLVAPVIYLLVGPFYLEINSIQGFLRIRFHRIASASMVIDNNSLKINLLIAGWKKQIDPFSTSSKTKKSAPTKKKAGRNFSFRFVKVMLNSFKVNKCYISLDMGSMPLNGMLYPSFYGLSRLTGKSIGINFSGNNELVLEVENSIARIVKTYIIYSFTQKLKTWTI